MRIGNRLGAAVVGLVLSATVAVGAIGAESARRQKVPLGGTLVGQRGEGNYAVWLPTRFGGELTIQVSHGTLGPIVGPDGRERQNGHEIGNDAHGWYTFTVTPEKDKEGKEQSYSVSASFVQVGQSTRKPWNFYYWPTKADCIHEPWAGGNGRVDTVQVFGDDRLVATPGGYIAPGQDIVMAGPNGILETPTAPGDDMTWFPNLYDDTTFRGKDGTIYATPSPLLKYDQIFNSGARSWEANVQQTGDVSRWPGHCLGGAVASILLNEPTPAPGSGMTRDELKALWCELGENHYNHRIGDYATDIPPGPPRPGFDETDRFVARFHQMLEVHIRGKKQALLGNLRAFPPRGTPNEVWNHGIGKFTARYSSVPGKGERTVKLDVALEANTGSSLNGQDEKPRIITYSYILVYGLDGRVDETQAYNCDWLGLGGEGLFCPLNILEVVETRWQGHNPYVTEANVRSLDLANGGGYGRFAAKPPDFRPVVSYEAGRAPTAPANPMFAGNTGSGVSDAVSPRRGGLFRFFSGR
jgi:hypothetical protein